MDTTTEFLDRHGITDVSKREAIIDCLRGLRESNAQSVLLRVRRGQSLIGLKADIPHGDKDDWLEEIAPLAGYSSTRTARRDIALALRIGSRLDDLAALVDEGSLSALQFLTQATSPVDALDIMNAEALAGRPVTKARAKRAALVAEELPGMEEHIAAGELTLEDAAAVAEAVSHSSASVRELVVSEVVRAPGVAQLLATWEQREPALFAEVEKTRAIYSPLTGESIPLRQANDTDALALGNEDETERIKRSWLHKGQQTPASRFVGKIPEIITALMRLDPERLYLAFVKPVEQAQPQEKQA